MESKVLSHIPARKVGRIRIEKEDVRNYRDLSNIGIGLDMAPQMAKVHAAVMDALHTTPSIPTAIRYLEAWLPGYVYAITTPRKIDELIGVTTAGRWHDEEVIQGIMEHTGEVRPYGDYSDTPYSSWNANYERRTIVRFEDGFQVGHLEDLRTGEAGINTTAEKRAAAGVALDIIRNQIGFYGYNGGVNRTYGFMNDPALPAYITVSGGTWDTKTFLEIQADITQAMAALQTQARGVIDTMNDPLTLALPNNRINYLSVTSDNGTSVRSWISETYPNLRIVTAPELDEANGGANVFYLYPETVNDGSTDNGRVFDQIVPARNYALGSENRLKYYVEAFSNALAGVMVKRPWAIVRFAGI